MQGLDLNLSEESVKRLREQFNRLIKELESKGKVDLRPNTALIKDDLKSITGSIDEVLREYQKLGRVSPPKRFYDENGNLNKFVIELERTEGIIERINYKANAFKDIGGGKIEPTSYGVSTITENDKRAQIAEKLAKQEIKAEDDIQKAIGQTIQKREEENRLLEERQANSINKNLEEEYKENLKLAEAMGKAREQAELKRKEEENSLQLNQAKASNKALDDDYKRVQGLGEFKQLVDPSLMSKSNDEIKQYIQSLYGVDSKIASFKKSTDSAGNSIVKMTVNTKNNKNEIQQEKVVLDQATNSLYKQEEAVKANTSRMVGFVDRIKNAFVAVTS